ncbi:Predicted acetyltransferase [Armatimonadetes bacterium GBS]|jgi:predicted acetyltransferase|nr:Predicted acetyltransferase [Armatimonadetes bacterium GBS]
MRWLFREPAVHVALVPPEEEEAFLHIICQSFNVDLPTARPYFYDDPYYPHNQRWGLWVEESGRRRLVSVLTAVPLQMWIGERAVPFMGIAGVATHPAYRRRGYATHLLRQVAETLREQAVPVAVLQAFDHNFYRRLGWETVGTLARLRIEPSRLPAYPITGVRRAEFADYEALIALHRQLAPRKTGMLVRDDLRWDYLLWNFRNKWVFEHAGAIEGYLIHDYLEGGWVLRVREFLWRTERARRALLGWLARNGDHVRQIEFAGTLSELQALGIIPLSERHSQPEEPLARYELLAGFMARLLDTQRLLETLLHDQPAPEGFQPFCLRVQDRFRGTSELFVVGESEGRLRVSRPESAIESVRVPIEALTQMVFGAQPATEIALRRRLAIPEETLRLLESLFPPREPCLRPMDFF